ncbi:ABC transporter permease [Massilia horti]|uniref:FtsX-like permease family protein n=1 Tax=Massilia horti TaxID=2562153 RepID=A0A4Y9T1Z2_9BURK|nr:ABC transporter permease [Massilia horti]TFW31534.1 FtsX-like permease family protein [Massilia horti]
MFRNYLLTAYKVFMRRKLFTAINLLCIVLTLVVLTVVAALLETAFYPKGVEGKSDRFLQVLMIKMEAKEGHGYTNGPLGYKLIEKYLKPMQGVERVAAVTIPSSVSVYQGDRVSELLMRRADADYWKVLDFTLLAGRLLTVDDDHLGRAVVVVNQTTARQLFPGGPSAAVGQKINVSGRIFEIVGVVDDTLHLNSFADIWAPISSSPSSEYRDKLIDQFTALILAHSKADLPRIRSQVEQIARGVVPDDPKRYKTPRFWADSKIDLFARLTVGNDQQADSGAGKLVAIIVAAMLIFMLLPALNMVNLNTGRIMERRAEIGIRKAFGATSTQLAAQLVVENILLCLAGGLIGLVASAGVLVWLEHANLIPYLKVSLNLAVFGYAMLIATVFGLISGVLPAWKMSRLDPVHALKGAA